LAIGSYWYVQPAASILSWLLLGGICAFLIHRWWYSRYALVFSVAMSFGAKLALTFIYFIIESQQIKFPEWWGRKPMCPLGDPIENIPVYL
jgi:energy-coupling factor transporter transmembrane protein EcfT